MLGPLWNSLLVNPLVNSLVFLHQLTGNLGWAIIIFTVFLRFIMTPLVLPGLRLSKKMQDLAPELAKLKLLHKDNKQALLTAQSELYKKNGANPAAGCLPQIVQLVVLIALFSALNLLLHNTGADLLKELHKVLYTFNQVPATFHLSSKFFYLDLVKPDVLNIPGVPFPLPGIVLLLAAASQFISGKMMSPQLSAEKKIADTTPKDTDDAMVAAQSQMLVFLPLMTIIFGFQFPSGLVLYWMIFSLVSMVQQYTVTGWGGLTPWLRKANLLK